MDVTERLRTLLRPCSWVRDSSTALRLVPELAVDMPAPLDLATLDGASERAIPVRCLDSLLEPVATVVLQLGEASLEGKAREELHRAGADRILGDALVMAVAELLAQAASPGLSAQAVPALSVAWLTSRMLAGSLAEIKDRRPDLAGKLAKLHTRLTDLPSARRGTVLADIAWGVRGRLAAAVSVAQAGGYSVEAGGLYRRVMADSLVLAFPRGTLDENIPFGVLASLLGLPLEESLASSIERAAAAVIPALVDRRARGKATPTDDALASAFSADLAAAPNARGVLFDLWSGPLLIASLPDLADKGLLAKAGISKEVAAALLRREVVRALAASWRDLVTALLSWDVMSALVSRLYAVRQEKGRWTAPIGRLPPHPRWELLVPRPLLPAAKVTVVAVGLGSARARVARVASERGRALLAGAADGAWTRLCAETPAAVCTRVGERGLAAFQDPLAALAFARKARQVLGGPGRVQVGYLGDPIELPPGVSAPVGIATGEISGGTDGDATWLDGPAVLEAINLCGAGEPELSQEQDPAGVRAVVVASDGLRSRGITASAAALAAIVHAARDTERPCHVRGKGGVVGGVSDSFHFYPIHTWLEPEDGTIVAALAIAGQEGPCELLVQAKSAFPGLHETDAELSRTHRKGAAPAPAVPASSPFAAFQGGSAPAADPFAGGGGGGGDPFAGGSFAAADPFAAAPPAPSWSAPAPQPAPPAAPPPPARPAPAPPPPAPAPGARPAPARPAPPPAPPPAPAAPARATAASSAADLFGSWGSPAASSSSLDEDLGDPFADFDTEPGRVSEGLKPIAQAPAREVVPAWSAPPISESAPTLAPATQPLESTGLEYFDPLPPGDLFGDSYEGPAVSIEEDGWGGESELEQEPTQGGGPFGFAAIPEGPETPASTPAAPSDAAWSTDFNQGFMLPDEGGASEEADDLFGPSKGGAGAVLRTENILELEAGGMDMGFRQAPAAHDYKSTDLSDRLTEDAGGSLFEADGGGSGFAFIDEPLEEEPPPAPTSPSSPSSPSDAQAPITWGDLGAAVSEAAVDAAELGALFGDADPGMESGTPFDAFPDPDSSQAIFESEPEEEEEGELGTGLSLEDFPLVGAEPDAFADWETGSFNIEEPEDPPSVPSAPFRPPIAPSAPPPPAPAPPPRAAPPPPPPPAPAAPASAPSSASSPAVPDFGYLFMGYVLFEERGEAVFGRPYGRLLVDAHAYPSSGGLEGAYRGFLADKVREGFVPRTDLTRPYPSDQPGQKLDQSLLVRAYRAMIQA